MGFLDKFVDWSTNNSQSYKQEKLKYEDANEEMDVIDDLLNTLAHQDLFFEHPEMFEDLGMSLKSLLDFKKVKLRQMANENNMEERQKIKEEIIDLDLEYEKTLVKVKNRLLKIEEISEIQDHILKLNGIILKNAHMEVFKKVHHFVDEDWTLKKMQYLRNAIALRNQILISYLGNFPDREVRK